MADVNPLAGVPKLWTAKPDSVDARPEPQTITLLGERLQPGCVVFLNDTETGDVLSVTETHVDWSVVLATPGIGAVRIQNPDGKRSGPIDLVVTEMNAPILRPSEYGPQRTIGSEAPVGAITINPGDNIQTAINAASAGATFWLRKGIHPLTASLAPKSNQSFVGEFGAVLEGLGWTPPDATGAAFRIVESAVVNVTIRNLIIRNVMHKGVYVFHSERNKLTGWVIEYNEIHTCGYGVAFGSGFRIQHNHIHDCRHKPAEVGTFGPGGAYAATGNYSETVDSAPNVLDDVVFLHNHFENCGVESHVNDIINFVFRDNWFQRMDLWCMWCDGVGIGFIAEDNLVEDCGGGVHYELSMTGIIRGNTFRRVTDTAVHVSTSGECEVYNNVFEDCFRAVTLRVNFGSIPPVQTWGWNPDCTNNNVHDNTFRIPAAGAPFACYMAYQGTPTGGQLLSDYAMPGNIRNNVFDRNTYQLMEPGDFPWGWAPNSGSMLDFAGWQALPQDPNGSSS